MKLRWLIHVVKDFSKHEYSGNKWSNTWERYTKPILQYSLDGEAWLDVECTYVEVPKKDMHLYQWESEMKNTEVILK